ncbi:MAG: methyl-accepting chemotaxis protein [Desulfopila sp.]|jgi:methyl-accepting chemotaxis protein|nr:methyl-accepting chemotaxis protein [Desulfopila sp.]
MFSRFNLKTKLLAAFFLVGIIPFSIMAVVALTKSSSALSNQAFDQMQSLRDVKKGQVENYLLFIKNQVTTFSENKMIVQAMDDFSQAYDLFLQENTISPQDIESLRTKLSNYYSNDFSNAYREANNGQSPAVEPIYKQINDTAVALQYHYIKANSNPLGSKDALNAANDTSQYSEFHKSYHPIIRNYLQKFGYYDIFLIHPKTGNIIYSVFKELDYATSLINGPYAQTNFAQAFKKANSATTVDAVVFEDFKQYFPSYEAPAGFVASPIFKDNKKIGVLVFQFPLDNLNAIMKERSGMGETGETYLVGSDNLMRSDSYLDPKYRTVSASFKNPAQGSVDTEATNEALRGITGEKLITDYNNNPVISAFTPLQFEGLKWALLAEIDEAEAFAAVKTLQWTALVVSLICLAGIVGMALFLARSIVKPISSVVANLTDLSQGEGDLTTRLPVVSDDEIGVLATRFNEFMDKLHAMITDITSGVGTLSSSSTELTAISQQMSANAEQTSGKSNTVATAAEEMSANMSSVSAAMEESNTNFSMVASATEEMTATISEIAENAENARAISEQAVKKTHGAREEMSTLGEAAQAIGKVTETITEISEQTNLLALNATIEAARAGEAGKGFAVVANEIKELAKQTAEATLDIKNQIDGVQGSTGSAVRCIEEIGEVISNVNEIVATIATAVEEQSVSTREIADNISQVSSGASEINENVAQSTQVVNQITAEISEVNQASVEMTGNSAQVNKSAEELSQLAEKLREMVGRFKI